MESTSTIGLYTKALGTLVVTGLTAYITALADDSVNTQEWITIAIAVLVGTGVVWAVPSTPEVYRKYGKASAGALVAGLASVAVGLTDGGGLSQAEIVTAIVALITALGVVSISPNAASSDPVNAQGRIVPVSLSDKQALVVPAAPPAGRGD